MHLNWTRGRAKEVNLQKENKMDFVIRRSLINAITRLKCKLIWNLIYNFVFIFFVSILKKHSPITSSELLTELVAKT